MPTSHRGPLCLTRLLIENFRGIDRLELKLTDAQGEPLDTIVLAGDNGCGKTTILEAILLLLGQRELLPEDSAPLPEQVRFGAQRFGLRGSVQRLPGTQAELFEEPAHFDLQADALDEPLIPKLAWGGRMTPRPNGEFWQTIEKIRPRVEYFSARREPEALGKTPSPIGRRSESEARRVVELKKRLVSAYFRRQRAQERGQIETIDPFTRIQKVWDYFYSGSHELDVIQVSNDPGSDWEVVLREAGKLIPADITSLAQARQLASERPDIPRLVPLDRLSSGQVSLFSFAGPLIFRDEPVDIVLIDEPEQHMHVLWQQLFVGLLRTIVPEAQIILATHSPEILRSVRTDQQFLLMPDSDPRAKSATSESNPSEVAP